MVLYQHAPLPPFPSLPFSSPPDKHRTKPVRLTQPLWCILHRRHQSQGLSYSLRRRDIRRGKAGGAAFRAEVIDSAIPWEQTVWTTGVARQGWYKGAKLSIVTAHPTKKGATPGSRSQV